MGAQVKLVLLATTSGSHGAGLCPVGGIPTISYWLHALKSCPRLLPVHDKVFIVTSPETHDLYLEWARSTMGAFTADNLLCCDVGGGDCPVTELAFALSQVPSLLGSYVVVASLDYFVGMDVPLRQLVEHTVIRGKDVVAYTMLPPGHSLTGHATLQLDAGGSSPLQPRVTEVQLEPHGEADGSSDAVMAPIMVLHPSSLAAAQAAAQAEPVLRGPKQLAWLAQQLMAAGKPVYSLQVDLLLECVSAQGVHYTNAYIDYCQRAEEQAARAGTASQALAIVTAHAQEGGVVTRGDLAVEQLLAAASPAKQLLLRFDAEAALQAKDPRTATATMLSMSETTSPGTHCLPVRFADVNTRRHAPKIPHPLYETTSSEIGRLKPSQMHMPDRYAGNSQAFSTSFAGPVRCLGLVTAVTRSKVHNSLDDF